jgi:hypothetical protein
MRTTHAVFVSILLFAISLTGGYLFNRKYDGIPIEQFLMDYITPITWACVALLVGITVDFLRRATHPTNYHDVNQLFFLWCITIAVICQLILGICEGVLLRNESSRLNDLFNGYEPASVVFIVGSVAFNVLSYAISVDLNIKTREAIQP